MVYVKPNFRAPSQLDQYIPISKASITFDNFSNLCSNFKQFNLYECGFAAGLNMDWHQWRGWTQGAGNSIAMTGAKNDSMSYTSTGYTQLSGGPLLLRMGQDIALQPGLAPGCLGNYSLQVTLDVDNSKGFFNYVSNCTVTIIAINTGFFETVRGQSMIRKTILDQADVLAATPDSGLSRTHLNRLIGRGMSGGSFSNMLHKGLSAFKKAKEINERHDLTGLARQYGGTYGSMGANAAETLMNTGASAHDAIYGSGKRHRPSGL